ncbi:hypothetical protein DFH09DRAFT_1143719 [Mycena vulgaris]|nr:hypothetical protein DFH09DRAFT_1143719 [Mycena vulgaris]
MTNWREIRLVNPNLFWKNFILQNDLGTYDLSQLLGMANERDCIPWAQKAISRAVDQYFIRGDHLRPGSPPADLIGTVRLALRVQHYELVDVAECVYIQKLQASTKDFDVTLTALRACSPSHKTTAQWKVALETRTAEILGVLDNFKREIIELEQIFKYIKTVRSDM